MIRAVGHLAFLKIAVLLLCAIPSVYAGQPRCERPRLYEARPVHAAATGEVAIATQNLWRLFDDVDDGVGEVVASTVYWQRLDKWATQITAVLRTPTVLAVQEAENISVLQALAERIAAAGGPVYQAVLLEGFDQGGIDVGYLVAAEWKVVQVRALLTEKKNGPQPLFDRPPLHMRLLGPRGQKLELINLHLKSLRGSERPDKAEAVRRKRMAQTQSLAAWLRDYLHQNPQAPLVLLGDFNATPEVLGNVDVLGEMQSAGLRLLTTRLPEEER